MKRTASAMLVVLISMLAPLGAHAEAGSSCEIAFDPAYDTYDSIDGGIEDLVLGGRGGGVDITTVRMTTTPDALQMGIDLRDLTDAPNGTEAFYTVSWTSGEGAFAAGALRSFGGWTYRFGARNDDGTMRWNRTTGALDPGRGRVTIDVPRSFVGIPTAGELLSGVETTADEMRVIVSGDEPAEGSWVTRFSDRTTAGAHYVMGEACAGPSVDGQMCSLLSDDAHDEQGMEGAQGSNASLDITTITVTTNPSTVVFGIHLRDLAAGVPDDVDAERWEVSWLIDGQNYRAAAERDRESSAFSVDAPDGPFGARGWFDTDTDVITIAVPRRQLPLGDDAKMRSIQASGWGEKQGISFGQDQAPGFDEEAPDHVVGVACADQRGAACPVTEDALGDVAPRVKVEEHEVSVPDRALDLLAAGATTTPDVISASARVPDPTGPLPEGFDTAGWTVSWEHSGSQWVAQATRGSRGETFTYARITSNGDEPVRVASDEPSGPIFGATRTTGSISSDGTIVIDIPLAALGAPTTGATFTQLGAVSWAARVGKATIYHVFDQTETRSYVVGIACGA